MIKRKIGILGGTFNPIHIAHLILAENAYQQLKLDEVWLMPAKNPPHKKDLNIVDVEHRLKMVEYSIKETSYFRITMADIQGDNLNYTYDTIKSLENLHQDIDFYFIIGGDSLENLEQWYRYQDLLAEVKFIVAVRNMSEHHFLSLISHYKDKYQAQMYPITIPNLDISSNELRKRCFNCQSIKYLVVSEVENYIKEQQLYKEELKYD